MAALTVVVIAGGMLLAALVGMTSYTNGMFWPSQVMQKWGRPGIAVVAHGGLWSDLLFLPFVLGWIVYYLGEKWESNDGRLALALGFIITAGNHINLCINQKVPDPLGWQKEWWSAAIALHFVYMWAACTIFVAAALTKGLDPSTAAVLAIVVGVHMMFGTHIPLGILNRFARYDKLPEFLRPDSFGLEGGLWVAMALAAWYAGGWRAMIPVVTVGIVWLIATAVVMATTEPIPQAQ